MANDEGDPEVVDGTKVWPPPGMKSWYAVTENIDGQPPFTYDLTVPSTFEEFDISTARVGRHGGLTEADLIFRGQLYARIGAITVSSGQVETAMKRLLLLLQTRPKAQFSIVDETWSELEKKLRRESSKGDDWRRKGLAKVLAWGAEKEVKRRRDDAIHACWADYAGGRVRRSRFNRNGNGTTILGSLEELDLDGNLLADYAGRLDGLLGSDWPVIMLPGPVERQPTVNHEENPGQ